MQKALVLALSLGIGSYALADPIIDLATTPLRCGNYTFTPKSTPAELNQHCKVIKSETEQDYNGTTLELKVKTDNTALVKCTFYNKQLRKCKMDD